MATSTVTHNSLDTSTITLHLTAPTMSTTTIGLDGGFDDGAGDADVSSPHKYYFLFLFLLYTRINFYFFTRLRGA